MEHTQLIRAFKLFLLTYVAFSTKSLFVNQLNASKIVKLGCYQLNNYLEQENPKFGVNFAILGTGTIYLLTYTHVGGFAINLLMKVLNLFQKLVIQKWCHCPKAI